VSDDPVDLSIMGLSADPVARAALVGRVVGQYLARRRLTIWRGIVDYRRPAIALMAAGVLMAVALSVRGVQRQTVVEAGPRVPPAIARWMAGPRTPGPLDVMFTMAEIAR
jgi:hypothetical protein